MPKVGIARSEWQNLQPVRGFGAIAAEGTMASLLARDIDFSTFGPSILARQTRGYLRGNKIPVCRLSARKMLRENCPLVPGVYGWLNEQRQLVYVGKSKSLRNRLLSYFSKTPHDKKAQRIRQHSGYLVWEPISNELLALIREQELIHRWRPEFNSQGQPTRSQPAFLCVSGNPAPNARLVRKISPNAEHVFGPISGMGRLRLAIESLNQVFNLRDCPDKTSFQFTNQRMLFDNDATAKCIRFELGSCPGPCAGLCSGSAYQDNVNQALQFLNGKRPEVLANLNLYMQDAAERKSFESAAIIRDCLENLAWLERRLEVLRDAQKSLSGVLPIQARRNRTAWLVLQGGRILLTSKAPVESQHAGELVDQIRNFSRQNKALPTSLLDMNLQLIVISWVRKNPQLNSQVLTFQQAIERCERILKHDSPEIEKRSA